MALFRRLSYAGLRLDRKAEGQHKAWSPWSWNPIQAGGVGSWARVTKINRIEKHTLFSEFISRRTNGDRWGPAKLSPQEIPACYFTRNFSTIKSYLGNGAWREETQPPGPPWGKIRPPRNAMAMFTANWQGIALFSPAATQN